MSLLDRSVLFDFDRTGYERHARAFGAEHEVDLHGACCAVTGAKGGIGYETALGLARRGAETLLLCRDPGRGQAAQEALRREVPSARARLVVVDMSDLESVRRAAAALPALDRLVHNAGVLPATRASTAQGLELTYATNLVGPWLLTGLVAPRFGPQGRVVWVSSGGMLAVRLDQAVLEGQVRRFDGVAAYAQTKRAMVIAAELLAPRSPGRSTRCIRAGPTPARSRHRSRGSIASLADVTKLAYTDGIMGASNISSGFHPRMIPGKEAVPWTAPTGLWLTLGWAPDGAVRGVYSATLDGVNEEWYVQATSNVDGDDYTYYVQYGTPHPDGQHSCDGPSGDWFRALGQAGDYSCY